MSITFYCGSGSPYAWRVWLALEHKQLPYQMQLMSFSAGDLKKPEYAALNPRQQVPVVVDDGFSLFESAAIVEYLEDRYPKAGQPLFPVDVKQRALVRRLVREADQYLAAATNTLLDEVLFTPREKWNADAIGAAKNELIAELERFEGYAPRAGFLGGAAGAADFTVYPIIALSLRMDIRKPDLNIRAALPPNLAAWMGRIEALSYFAKTLPPHWKKN